MDKAAARLLQQLDKATDPFLRLDLVERIQAAVTVKGSSLPSSTGAKIPTVVGALCKALCPLLDAALQDTDQGPPSRQLAGLDACAVLISALSRHMHCCEEPRRRDVLAHVQATGILTSLPQAMAKTHSLIAANSPACTSFTFTQFASQLMLLCSDLIRKTPNDLVYLKAGDPMTTLLLPGASLAHAVLRTYAGPGGAAILAANQPAVVSGGYEPFMVVQYRSSGPLAMTPALMQLIHQQAGRTACASAIANALRIADSCALVAYNSWNRVPGVMPGTAPRPARGILDPPSDPTLTQQVLLDRAVTQLVAVMMFVEAKLLHNKQGGRAAAAAQRTRTSGRVRQSAAGANGPAALVPPHHNDLAAAVGVDLLVTDDELFNDVTSFGRPPPGATPKAELTFNELDSTLIDPLQGMGSILAHCFESQVALSSVRKVMMSAALRQANTRVMGHINERTSQAMLLTAVELCLLAPSEAENALRLCVGVYQELVQTFIHFAGPAAVNKCGGNGPAHWFDGPSPLEHPDLQDLLEPVLRELVVLLVPLLLPECHDIALPATLPDNTGSKLSALLPQQVSLLVASASEEFLAQLLQEHPLYTTRALEAALRVEWAEKSVHAFIWCAVLRAIPAVLTRLAKGPAGAAGASSSSAAAAAASKLATDAANSRQLLAQLHSLLVTVAKFAASVNARALAAATDPAAASASSSISLLDEERLRQNTVQLAAHHRSQVESRLPPEFKGTAEFIAQFQADTLAMLLTKSTGSPGQFSGTLSVIGSAAQAAAALGRAVSQVAGSSSSVLAAPFVSLIGRCLFLTGAALTAASKDAPGLAAAEFDTCRPVLTTLLSCLDWVAADAACAGLLAGTGAADAAAVDSLRTTLQQQLQLQQEQGGRAVADSMCARGLSGQLQAVGGAMCSVSAGACASPACKALSELSELALVTPSAAKKGCGKCSACGSCSYCSRKCQVAHWRVGHKTFCQAHKKAAVASEAEAGAAATTAAAAAGPEPAAA